LYKLRIKYQKSGDLKFLSHLDLVRAFERGLRRAQLPLSLTEGFSPHPKISFGPPLPVGVSSEAEYVDAILDKKSDLQEIASLLGNSFPEELAYREARYIPLDSPSLMSLITLAGYRLTASVSPQPKLNEIENCIGWLLSEKEVTLMVRDKEKTYTVLETIRDLDVECVKESLVIFNFLGLATSAGGIKPEFVIEKAISRISSSPSIEFTEIHRTGLYYEKDGKIVVP